MIKIFNGKWRGLGSQDAGFGMILDFRFRSMLYMFRGAKLHVFIALALHSNQDGHSYPSVELIAKETGYDTGTVSTVTEELCAIEIDGQRVLAKFRERDENGRFVGPMHYVIFPDMKEDSSNEPSDPLPGFPTSGSGHFRSTRIEDKPVNREDKPITGEKLKLSEDPSLSADDRLFWEQKEKEQHEKKVRALDLPVEDLRAVQHFGDEGVKRVIAAFHRLWRVPIPGTAKYDRSRVKDWTNGALQIIGICGEYDPVGVLEWYKAGSDARATISNNEPIVVRPGSLVNMLGMYIAKYKPVAKREVDSADQGGGIYV